MDKSYSSCGFISDCAKFISWMLFMVDFGGLGYILPLVSLYGILRYISFALTPAPSQITEIFFPY